MVIILENLFVVQLQICYDQFQNQFREFYQLGMHLYKVEIHKTKIALRISDNTVIIDTTNYYPARDGRIDDIENGMPESVWVSTQLSHPVVKAYNSILAGSLVQAGLSNGSTSRIALPVSGDTEQAKNIVAKLVNDSGFDALDIGNLNDSWRQQPGSPVYCTDLNLSQLKRNIFRLTSCRTELNRRAQHMDSHLPLRVKVRFRAQ